MTFPPDPIAADKTDFTATRGDHPDHHNELAAAVNDIVDELQTARALANEHPVDVDISLYDPFGSGYLDLGVGGSAVLRARKEGCRVRGVLFVTFGTSGVDLGGGIVALDGADLPWMPRYTPGNFGEPGGFGYLSKPESGTGAGDGYLVSLASMSTYFGFGNPCVTFVRVQTSLAMAGGLETLWRADQPISNADLAGARYQVAIDYEVAE